MNNIVMAAGAACFALVVIESGIPFKLKRWLNRTRLKPFDCPFCLAWWVGIIFSIFFEKNVIETICIGSISAIIAVFLNKNLNK